MNGLAMLHAHCEKIQLDADEVLGFLAIERHIIGFMFDDFSIILSTSFYDTDRFSRNFIIDFDCNSMHAVGRHYLLLWACLIIYLRSRQQLS